MNTTINLIHLKFFCDAVIYESISEAARKNFISQSAVSQAITKLEVIFGVQLIFQNRQKLQVTDEGKIVFEQAKSIFKAVQNTFDKVNQTKDQVVGTVKFITTKSLGNSYLAPWYKSIKEKFPGINLEFRMGGMNVIRTALRHEEVEFAIVVYDKEFEQFDKHPLLKGIFNIYQSKDIAADAINEGVFVDELDSMYVSELKSYLISKGYENPVRDILNGWDLTARFTDLNIGVGFFPDYILATNRYPNIVIHPVEIPAFPYEICAIYNKGVKLSRTAELFLEHLKQE